MNEDTPTASSIFQKIAFGDPREPVGGDLARLQKKKPVEANTESEQYVLELLKRWVMSSTDDVAQRLFVNYKLFKRASRLYPNIFRPKTEAGTLLYRGLNYLTPDLLRKVKETKSYDWRQVQYDEQDYWIYSKPVEYIPERNVQSWTDEVEVSELFSGDAVLITRQDNHFLFNKDAIAVIFGSDESEILHFGKTFRNPVYLAVNDYIYHKYVLPSETPKLKSIAGGLFEDEVEDKFGKVAFGSDMDIVRLQGGKQGEKNTKYETELLQTLQLWVRQSDSETANKLYKKFSLLKTAAKVFPQILLPETPNGTTLYRGLDNPNQKLLDMISKTKKEDWEMGETIGRFTMFKYSKPIKYTPRRPVQSWSSDAKRAAGFFGSMGILLSTKQSDEFLFNQRLMQYIFNDANMLAQGDDEQEILHFGKTFKEQVYINITDTDWMNLFSK